MITWKWLTSPDAGNLGGFLSGISTSVAMLAGLWLANRWRRDRLTERRADAAAKAYEAAVRAAFRMRGYCEMLRSGELEPWEEANAVQAVTEAFPGINDAIRNIISALHEAHVAAIALLDDQELKSLLGAQKMANQFQNEMSGFLVRLKRSPHASSLKEIDEALKRFHAEFTTIEDGAESLLLPIARLQSGAGSTIFSKSATRLELVLGVLATLTLGYALSAILIR